jgi:hypothetical protein
VSTPAEAPKAWQELLWGLTLLARGQTNDISPLHCEHDQLTVMADPMEFAPEEIAQLEAWGFHPGPDEGTFSSFRFGSA